MLTEQQQEKITRTELQYKTARSGGKGGQNVNKVESKVEITFSVLDSQVLEPAQKEIILRKLSEAALPEEIRIVSEKHRSQLENKQEAQRKLLELLNKYLKPVRKRYATKPSRASKLKKLADKKKHGEKKSLRQKLR